MWIFLPECLLAHPEPDSSACEVGKALDFHLENLPPRFYTHLKWISLFLLMFVQCLEIQELTSSSTFQMSNCLNFPPPLSLSRPSLEKHFPFRDLRGYQLSCHSLGPQIMTLILLYEYVVST